MALIICPECGKTISDKAAACIGCGCPVSEMNMETVQPAGRAQRRRRYQPEQQEVAADAPAQPVFDQAAFDAALQGFFDAPIKLQTQTPAAQASETTQKAEAIQQLAQVTSMAAAQQAAEARPVLVAAPVQQMPVRRAQVTPAGQNVALARPVSVNPVSNGQAAHVPAQTIPVTAAAPGVRPADKPAQPAAAAPARQPVPNPAPAQPAPVTAAAPGVRPADKPAQPAAAAPARQPVPSPAPASHPAPSPAPVKEKKAKPKKAKAPKAKVTASGSDTPTAFAPDNTVPTEMPEYGLFFGVVMTLLREGIGVLSYAAMAAVAAMVVDLLSGGSGGGYIDPEILLGLLGGYAIAVLVVNLDFLRARRFLRKGGYLDAIRNDGPGMTNCVNAYKLYPSRAMIWYIKRLNPAHGAKIAQWAKEAKQEKRKARLRYLLYALVLAVVFYFLPRYEMIYDLVPMLGYYIPLYLTPTQILLIEHLITLVVVILYTDKNGADLEKLNLEVLIVFAGVFALMLYVYDMGDLWYHIIINAVVVFAAFIIGGIWHVKKK